MREHKMTDSEGREREADAYGSLSLAGEQTLEPMPCGRCGGEIRETWSAENNLWNEINGSPNGFLCPPCFNELAVERGYHPIWRVETERRADREGADPPSDQLGVPSLATSADPETHAAQSRASSEVDHP